MFNLFHLKIDFLKQLAYKLYLHCINIDFTGHST